MLRAFFHLELGKLMEYALLALIGRSVDDTSAHVPIFCSGVICFSGVLNEYAIP
jgi:hypothetical protein